MNNIDLDRINHLVLDLLVEFEKEAGKLRADYDNSSMRIREIDEHITNYKENEDVDIQVFSPRKVDNKHEVRLDSLNREKDEMQSSVRDIERQMKYYNDKIDKLKEIQSILGLEPSDAVGNNDSPARGIERFFNIDEKIKEKESSGNILNNISKASDNRDADISPKYDDEDVTDGDSTDTNDDNLDSDNSSLINSLSRISHKADVGYKIVDNDVFRAKMEFKSIKSNLEDIINSLK